MVYARSFTWRAVVELDERRGCSPVSVIGGGESSLDIAGVELMMAGEVQVEVATDGERLDVAVDGSDRGCCRAGKPCSRGKAADGDADEVLLSRWDTKGEQVGRRSRMERTVGGRCRGRARCALEVRGCGSSRTREPEEGLQARVCRRRARGRCCGDGRSREEKDSSQCPVVAIGELGLAGVVDGVLAGDARRYSQRRGRPEMLARCRRRRWRLPEEAGRGGCSGSTTRPDEGSGGAGASAVGIRWGAMVLQPYARE